MKMSRLVFMTRGEKMKKRKTRRERPASDPIHVIRRQADRDRDSQHQQQPYPLFQMYMYIELVLDCIGGLSRVRQT